MAVGPNILFDPSKEELAVADAVVAISAARGKDGELKMVALRTIDPPSRLTAAGVPSAPPAPASGGANSRSSSTQTASGTMSDVEASALREKDAGQTVWRPPRGGVSRTLLSRMIKAVVEKGGVGQEVLDGLDAVES